MELVYDIGQDRDLGLFMIARLLTRLLQRNPVDLNGCDWPQALTKGVERTTAAIAAEIKPWASPEGAKNPRAAKEFLDALAWAKGAGFPDDIWPIVATALSCSGSKYAISDTLIDTLKDWVGRLIEGALYYSSLSPNGVRFCFC